MVAKQPQNSEIFASSENGNQNTSNQQQSRVSSGTKLGSVAYGMLRKTKNKTYSALRGGSSKTSSDIIEEDEGFEMEYSHQAVGTDDLGAAPSHSTPLGSNRNGIDTVLRPRGSLGDRSLYFSPQNSWRDVGRTSSFGIGHGRTNVPLPPSFENDHSNGSTDELVRNVERTLRYVVVCCVFFMAGTLMPERAPIVSKALELSLVAWGTCLAIVGLIWFQRYKKRKDERIIQQTIILQPNEAITPPDKSKTPPLTVTNTEPFKPPKIERKINIANLDDEVEASSEPSSQSIQKRSYDEIAIIDSSSAPSAPKVMRESTAPSRVIPKQHAHLEDLYIMMVEKDKRIYPNGGATKIDNKLFSGEMLLMFRTPDADEPVSDVPEKDPIANYFRGKQRRFEFQWQFKLKKVPKGDVFMCCELDEPIRMGMIQRTLVNTVLKFVKKTNQGFSYFISDSVENPSYLSFPG